MSNEMDNSDFNRNGSGVYKHLENFFPDRMPCPECERKRSSVK